MGNFELKEFPAQIQLSPLYFKAHPKGENWVNPLVYIPQELVFQPPKKAGVSLYVTKKPASKSAKATEEESVEDDNDQEENDYGEPEAKKTATENNGVETAGAAAGRPKRA